MSERAASCELVYLRERKQQPSLLLSEVNRACERLFVFNCWSALCIILNEIPCFSLLIFRFVLTYKQTTGTSGRGVSTDGGSPNSNDKKTEKQFGEKHKVLDIRFECKTF